ncbi:hypothetical protein CVT24_013375 [Panaeolus cyanescens]|uniref:Uncharacterized protein n=1 Tax=Panaeolus cyanescens TaxID=181874 RepID=A0A409YMP4_9AGAR|nr:hypothetical protein CVT24_013375 [Panaeolus cyanescens]
MSSSSASSPAPSIIDNLTSISGRSSPHVPESTPASSPPNLSEYTSCATSEVGDNHPSKSENEAIAKEEETMPVDQETASRLARLQFLLKRSAVFSSVLRDRMEEEKMKQAERAAQYQKEQTGKKRSARVAEGSPSSKKKRGLRGEAVAVADSGAPDEGAVFGQPKLITGAKLKPYQLEGLQWMVSLDKNGISGILADEMGLGKTLQTIAFSAYLRESDNKRPFLIVCPLSVLHNWADEYAKFAPTMSVVVYHGTPTERAELRKTVMAPPGTKKRPTHPSAIKKKGRKSKGRPVKVVDEDLEDATEESFPIVLTTYDMIIKDRAHLAHYDWGYIVVDEGHRLKNMDCKLMKEIKKFTSAGRMILTGTPLHNNLAELWSLLNFILPDIFDDIDSFQQWFNLPELQSSLPTDQSQQIISSLHAILKPFLLRRLKADVELNLPPKKEYVLYAPLSKRQRETYDVIVNRGLRQWLISGGMSQGSQPTTEAGTNEEEEEEEDDEEEDKPKRRQSRRNVGAKNYDLDGDDEEYFDMVARGEVDHRGRKVQKTRAEEEEEQRRHAEEAQHRAKVTKVNNMKLQNVVMQLRKICSHPFLFDWPIDPKTREPILGEDLVNASGKMMVLDRLLRELFKRGHKVLLFSQFTTMLDIIEDWAVDHMGWTICRIDGKSGPQERREQMNIFQNGGKKGPCLFLLSTRAGGLGINLVAADTVIFYDQDWNPQMDAQAQDRAHRIGQTRPVLIFRLVSAHTIETKIMQRANEKRKLEALVIAKGKFKMPAGPAIAKRETIAEMAASLLRLEGEKIEVVPDTQEGKEAILSDADLDALLDRSPEVFAERQEGWTSSHANKGASAMASGSGGAGAGPVDHTTIGGGKKAAFAVFNAPAEEGNDALANMLSEEHDEDD